MDHPFVHFLSLLALVCYPPIPLVVMLIHVSLPFWKRVGTKSYTFFIFIFALCYALLFFLVWYFKEPILAWKLYEDSFMGLGALIFVAGVGVGIITVRTLSLRVLLGFPEIQSSHYPSKLVTQGIYRYLRHPRYLEFILEVLGIAILSGLVWNFILFMYMVPAVWLLSVVEERELVERFGKPYVEYRKVTGRFWPRLFQQP